MDIDFNKIVTDDFKKSVSEEKLMEIKKEALTERRYIRRNGYSDFLREHFFIKADEIAYLNCRNQEKNDAEKALLAANICFDDEKFAEILLKGNFGKDSLETYLKLLSYLKRKMIRGNQDDMDEKFQSIVEKYTRKLSKHFSLYVGKTKPNIIINKINEVLSYNPTLLDTEKNTHNR